MLEPMTILLLVYNLFFPLVLLCMLPSVAYRMLRRGKFSHRFGQRFAMYSRNTLARLRMRRGEWIWIHAVSVGEVLVALKFIRELNRERETPVVLSTTTTTGYELARTHKTKFIEVIYHPLDFLLCARKAIRTIRPKALVLVEAEVWPNLITLARRVGAPVLLINARLSKRSWERFRKFRWLSGPLFRSLDAICLQDESDVKRFTEIGADPDRLFVTGSIKFDIDRDCMPDPASVRAQLDALGIAPERPILLGASTHPGEEAALGRVIQRLRKEIPALFAVIVPRHFERGAQAAADLEKAGLNVARSSANPQRGCDVLLADRTGELRKWIALADVVFIGKSLTAHGGQNPSEAIMAEKPIIFGPNMHNFQPLVDMILANDCARLITNEEELFLACRDLLLHPDSARAMARRAKAVLEPHRGATTRTRGILEHLIATKRDNSTI
jgi:3-deoxy-D-manno-octulosonic-acid transferase